MPNWPVPLEPEIALERLRAQERELTRRLTELEDDVRRFEALDRPAFERWRRLEFGPTLQALEEALEKVHVEQVLARRVIALIEQRGLSPREALYLARHPEEEREEIEARRDAKREAKREARRSEKRARQQAKREEAANSASGAAPKAPSVADSRREEKRTEGVALYRRLAFRLHPDTRNLGTGLSAERADSLWLEVQAAYEAGDFDRLLSVGVWLDQRVGQVEAAPAALDVGARHRRVRALRKAMQDLERRVTSLRQQPGWGFESLRGGDRRKLRQRVAREIENEHARVQETLAALEEFFEEIGSPKAPKARVRR